MLHFEVPDPEPAEYVPITPAGGRGLVHAVSLLSSTGKTVCGRKWAGWCVAVVVLSCPTCRQVVHLDVRPR